MLWGFSTKIWDIAAGVLLIREAGGMVTSIEGGEVDLGSGRFLASANRSCTSNSSHSCAKPCEVILFQELGSAAVDRRHTWLGHTAASEGNIPSAKAHHG